MSPIAPDVQADGFYHIPIVPLTAEPTSGPVPITAPFYNQDHSTVSQCFAYYLRVSQEFWEELHTSTGVHDQLKYPQPGGPPYYPYANPIECDKSYAHYTPAPDPEQWQSVRGTAIHGAYKLDGSANHSSDFVYIGRRPTYVNTHDIFVFTNPLNPGFDIRVRGVQPGSPYYSELKTRLSISISIAWWSTWTGSLVTLPKISIIPMIAALLLGAATLGSTTAPIIPCRQRRKKA